MGQVLSGIILAPSPSNLLQTKGFGSLPHCKVTEEWARTRHPDRSEAKWRDLLFALSARKGSDVVAVLVWYLRVICAILIR